MSGICAAISAARQGITVNLVESSNSLGGRIGEELRLPYDLPGGSNSIFPREHGLLDEILLSLMKFNTDGSYAGQSRVLASLLIGEPRIQIFTGIRAIETKLSSRSDKLLSCLGLCQNTGERHLFKADYFADCTGTGNLSRLTDAPGETGRDLGAEPNSSNLNRFHRMVALINISRTENLIPFVCPEWVKVKWENNHLSARVEWMESLDQTLEGYHHIEWVCPQSERLPTAEEVAWAAWDYIKNRSPLKKTAKQLSLERISPLVLQQADFRGLGEYTLTGDDVANAKPHYDSVVFSRAAIDGPTALLCSNRGKISLAQPFEIPFRALYSKKVRNLFWTGAHASATHESAPCLGHSPTAAQMGVAVGHSAAHCVLKNRQPRTLSKKGHISSLQKSLQASNHRTGHSLFEDDLDLVKKSQVSASSSWDWKCQIHNSLKTGPMVNSCLVQMPLSTSKVDQVSVAINISQICTLEARLLQGSSFESNLPGDCLQTCTVEMNPGDDQLVHFPLPSQITNKGWHYLEIHSSEKFSLPVVDFPTVGFEVLYPQRNLESRATNSFNSYSHQLAKPFPFWDGPIIQVQPPQPMYLPENVKNSHIRPSSMPNLWISKPTDFKYPEFLEFSWDKPVESSRICLNFDASYNLTFPRHPLIHGQDQLPSIIKDYRIYVTDILGKSRLLVEERNNFLAFREHRFEPTTICGMEVEILSTGGLDRAQIFRVSAYE